jgi:hypothetical protein
VEIRGLGQISKVVALTRRRLLLPSNTLRDPPTRLSPSRTSSHRIRPTSPRLPRVATARMPADEQENDPKGVPFAITVRSEDPVKKEEKPKQTQEEAVLSAKAELKADKDELVSRARSRSLPLTTLMLSRPLFAVRGGRCAQG